MSRPALAVAVVVVIAVVVVLLYFGGRIALCEDGAVTFSRGEPGACSGHGGLIR